MSDNEDMFSRILKKLDKNQESLNELDKKLELHRQETKYEFQAIKDLDTHQNSILEEHAKRSDRLEQDNKLREEALRKELKGLDSRVETLELPKKWFAVTKKWLIWIAATVGAISMIWEAIQKLGN